jgi:hypothetical protein
MRSRASKWAVSSTDDAEDAPPCPVAVPVLPSPVACAAAASSLPELGLLVRPGRRSTALLVLGWLGIPAADGRGRAVRGDTPRLAPNSNGFPPLAAGEALGGAVAALALFCALDSRCELAPGGEGPVSWVGFLAPASAGRRAFAFGASGFDVAAVGMQHFDAAATHCRVGAWASGVEHSARKSVEDSGRGQAKSKKR